LSVFNKENDDDDDRAALGHMRWKKCSQISVTYMYFFSYISKTYRLNCLTARAVVTRVKFIFACGLTNVAC